MKVIGALQLDHADHLNNKLPERILTRTRLKGQYRRESLLSPQSMWILTTNLGGFS